MAKDSDRKRGRLDAEETGGGLSGLLAEEDEFDRRTLWRLGTWAAISVGAVVVALVTNQSSIGLRHEQTASADLLKQAQQLQLTAKTSQSETRRLASAVDTLNGDRDRLYARVAVLEQGLDSVTGAIARQAPAPSPPPSPNSGKTSQASASAAQPVSSSAPPPAPSPVPAPAPASTTAMAPAATASTTPAISASAELGPAVSKPAPPAPVAAPVAATPTANAEKKDKQASATVPPEPSPVLKLADAPQSASTQPFGYLMLAPPDPAAEKLTEPTSAVRQTSPPKTFTSAPMPEIAAVAPTTSEEKASDEKTPEKKATEEKEPEESKADAPPELVARRTEFGVDVGGANSVPGLRALWRGLLRSRSNAALATLRPIIVIKENNNGLGMQLRLVAGPINDAAAAAKICASLTVSERGCSTTVFEGQRLSMGNDEQPKSSTRSSAEAKPLPASEAKPEAESKPRYYSHRHYAPRRQAKEEDPPPPPPPPKEEPSTLSRIFGAH